MKKILNVQGMHCNSCKLLVEKSLGSLENVQKVNANVAQGTVSLEYIKTPNFDDIKRTIKESGYKVVEDKIYRPWFSTDINDYKLIIFSLVGFIFLYFLLSKTGIFSFDIKSQGAPSLSLILLIGLTAGFSSCMAVVGGLVLAVSSKWNKNNDHQTFGQKIVPHFWFNAGRVIGFGILGGILGLFGSVISLSPFMMAVMTLIVGVVMILLGINLTHISPKLSAISVSLPTGKFFNKKETDVIEDKKPNYMGVFLSGALTFFLPCGFTFAMQLYALSTGNFWMGMAVMAIFAIGTLPGLLSIGSLASIFKGKTAQMVYKIIGVLVVLLGLYNISNSYSVVATKFHTQQAENIITVDPVQQTGEQNIIQPIPVLEANETINMTYTENGFTPEVLNLKIGKTYTIIVDVQTTVYGCMSTMYIPGLDENIQAIKNGQKIQFTVTPKNAGTFDFTCAMGLPHGAKIIVQ